MRLEVGGRGLGPWMRCTRLDEAGQSGYLVGAGYAERLRSAEPGSLGSAEWTGLIDESGWVVELRQR